MLKELKKCEICGNDYFTVGNNQKYCTDCIKNVRKMKNKEYYIRDRKERMEASKIYYEENKEYILERTKEYNKRPEVIKRHKKYSLTPKFVFLRTRVNAKARKLEFSITLEQVEALHEEGCIYCGENVKGRGFDRVDNNKGYTIDNIVPCCGLCNWMKKDLTVEDFIEHCKKIIKNS